MFRLCSCFLIVYTISSFQNPLRRTHSCVQLRVLDGNSIIQCRESDKLQDPSWLALVLEAVGAHNRISFTWRQQGGVHDSKLPPKLTATALQGALCVWEEALSRGVLPFSHELVWPPEAVLARLSPTLQDLNIPHLTMRHPLLVPIVLRALLTLSIEFAQKFAGSLTEERRENEVEELDEVTKYVYENCEKGVDTRGEASAMAEKEKEELAAEFVVNQFQTKWKAPMTALSLMDDVYGPNHGMMKFADETSAGGEGWGLFDGIWEHVGWRPMRDVSEALRGMPELRDMIRFLGRRPSMAGTRQTRMPPQTKGSYPGVACSSQMPDGMEGIKQSASLEGLLSSEASLLASSLQSHEDKELLSEAKVKQMKKVKLLFLSRLLEGKLRSYDISGWEDLKSKPRHRPWKYSKRMPVKPGGPLIVCIDTSWSMHGHRELIAKSIVLECAIHASNEGRALYVLAFSGRSDLKEYKVDLSLSQSGLQNLLEFLGKGFHGGTDVTKPLEKAIDLGMILVMTYTM